MYDSLNDVLEEYGCNLSKFLNSNTLNQIITNFNNIVNVDSVKYITCKDDTGIFVLVTTRYVIKVYNIKTYLKIVDIYNKLWRNNNHGNIFNHIEKIYYYFSTVDGIVVHNTYYYNNIIKNLGTTHLTINEILVPLFPKFNKTNVIWNYDNTKKLLIDTSLGLIELHRLGIIHGDTTPDNMGLRLSDNNFVLYDFGDAYEGSDYKSDVIRFLNSVIISYKNFFADNIDKIEQIKNTIDKNKNYGISDFYDTIIDVFV